MDELEQCNKLVGKDDNRTSRVHSHGLRMPLMGLKGVKSRRYFPFKQGSLFVATLRVGSEGVQMTVDGKHVTSFAYREVISKSSCGICLIINSSVKLKDFLAAFIFRPWSHGLLVRLEFLVT